MMIGRALESHETWSGERREYIAVVEHLLAFSHPLLSAWLSTRQASATFPWSHRERRAGLWNWSRFKVLDKCWGTYVLLL